MYTDYALFLRRRENSFKFSNAYSLKTHSGLTEALAPSSKFLAEQLTLSQPGVRGADYAHHSITSPHPPTGFSDLATALACLVVFFVLIEHWLT